MAGQRMTAEALAAQFAARVNEHGWCWLSVKQTAFLKGLAQPVYRGSTNVTANVVFYVSHGTPVISGTLPGGREFEVSIRHNGAGCFKLL
jgi:hypothetical protein